MHPCRTCGACCATFRVSFYRGEAMDGEPDSVPSHLVTDVGPFRVAMIGTTVAPTRCVALEGTVGGACGCSIHPVRPTPCREFAASWEDGTPHDRCDKARAAHGLPPLRPEDYEPGG